jgi:hypothetical protein
MFAHDRGGSLERLHRPNPCQYGCMSFKGRVGFNVMTSLDPGYLNAGFMKPWRGFTPIAGKKNWGWANLTLLLTIIIHSF